MHISVIEVPLKNNVWLIEQALVSQCGERRVHDQGSLNVWFLTPVLLSGRCLPSDCASLHAYIHAELLLDEHASMTSMVSMCLNSLQLLG